MTLTEQNEQTLKDALNCVTVMVTGTPNKQWEIYTSSNHHEWLIENAKRFGGVMAIIKELYNDPEALILRTDGNGSTYDETERANELIKNYSTDLKSNKNQETSYEHKKHSSGFGRICPVTGKHVTRAWGNKQREGFWTSCNHCDPNHRNAGKSAFEVLKKANSKKPNKIR